MSWKKWIGAIFVVLLASGVFVLTFEDVRIRVDNDKSTLYRPHEVFPWIWSPVGREYGSFWDGSSKMNRNLSGIYIYNRTGPVPNSTYITRVTPYIRGPMIIDEWYFEGDIDDKELFPISHKVMVRNATGFIYQYEVRDLIHDGSAYGGYVKYGDDVKSPQSFGRDVKVEWQDGYYWSRLFKTGILKVRYRITSDYEAFYVRLFDPINQSPGEGNTDYGGNILNITSDVTMWGSHYNISEFHLASNATVTIMELNSTSGTGTLRINATKVYAFGTFVGDGRGGGGGSGGGGGGVESGGGSGGTPTDQQASDGTNGDSDGDTGGESGGAGGAGDGPSAGSGGAGGGGSGASCVAVPGAGSAGSNAGPNNDTSINISAFLGSGGGGGGGGGGSAANPNGGYAGGGGHGQDGGAYLILIGRNFIQSNATYNFRDGQNTGTDGVDAVDGTSGDGGNNSNINLVRSSGGSGEGGDCQTGGAGGIGGFGSGGMVVFASYNVNLTNATIDVIGGTAGLNGSIKVLSTNSTINGTYNNWINLTVSNFTDGWFEQENSRPTLITDDVTILYTKTTDFLIQQANGTDADGDTLNFSIDSDPLGKLDINVSTGNITLNANLTFSDIGSYSIRINVTDNLNLSTSINQSTFTLTISDFDDVNGNITLLLDGVNTSRKYELQYVLNLTVTTDANDTIFLDIDHPNYGVNFTQAAVLLGETLELLLNISNLSIQNFTGDVASVEFNSTGGRFNITLSNKTELASLEFNISGEDISGYPDNLSIHLPGNSTSLFDLFGELRDQELFVDDYFNDGTLQTTGEIFFVRAGTGNIQLPISKPIVNGTLNLVLNGTQSNEDNDLEYFEVFNSTNLLNNSLNVLLRSGSRGYYDNFTDDDLTGDELWIEFTTPSTATDDCEGSFVSSGGDYVFSVTGRAPTATQSSCDSTTENGVSSFDLKDFYGFETNLTITTECEHYGGSTVVHTHTASIHIIDGTSSATLKLYSDTLSCVIGNTGTLQALVPLRVDFVEDVNGDITSARVFINDTLDSTVGLTGLSQSSNWDVKFVTHVEDVSQAPPKFSGGEILPKAITTMTLGSGFSLSGVAVDNTTLVNGERNSIYNSSVIFSSANNITSARFNWNVKVRDNNTEWLDQADLVNSSLVEAHVFLSADNGTNWQEATDGALLIFDTPGTGLRYYVNLTTRDPTIYPVFAQPKIEITPEFIGFLEIDVGADGIIEGTVSNLNSSTLVVINDSSVLSDCEGIDVYRPCNATVQFITNSSGRLQILSINYSHDPNPLYFNTSDGLIVGNENITDPGVQFNFTNGNVTVSGLDWRYWGSGNVSVTAHTSEKSSSHNLIFRYSQFDIFSPVPWFQFAPATVNSKEVEPQGQRAKFNESIFNLSISEDNDDNVNITFWPNQTIDSCLTIFGNNVSTTHALFTFNNSGGESDISAYQNVNNSHNPLRVYLWLNLTSCGTSVRYYDPFEYFNSYCVDCVRNLLNNNTVTG